LHLDDVAVHRDRQRRVDVRALARTDDEHVAQRGACQGREEHESTNVDCGIDHGTASGRQAPSVTARVFTIPEFERPRAR
jgi:hypothetical protein